MSLARSFPTSDLDVTIFLPRARKKLPPGIHFKYTMMIPFRYLPWRYGQRTVIWSHERKFRRAIDHADPRRTVAYFWPSPLGAPTAEMIAHVQRRGSRRSARWSTRHVRCRDRS